MTGYSQGSTKHRVQDIEMLKAGSIYTMVSYLPQCFSWLTEELSKLEVTFHVDSWSYSLLCCCRGDRGGTVVKVLRYK